MASKAPNDASTRTGGGGAKGGPKKRMIGGGSQESESTHATSTNTSSLSSSSTSGSRRSFHPKKIGVEDAYRQQCVTSGITQSRDVQQSLFAEYVRTDLFKIVKFITRNRELDFGGDLATKVLRKMSVRPDEQRDYWEDNSHSVSKTLGGKRGNTNNEIKNGFMGKNKQRRAMI